MAVGGSATGTIGTAGDNDRFAVDLTAEHAYRFDLTGSPGGGGTLRDTYFRAIYNSAGQYQPDSYNDDSGSSRDSQVTFTPTESGTYYARVSGDRNETGSYTLSVTDVTQEQTVPAKPTGLTGAATHDAITLTWDDPGDGTITGYVILRRVRVNDQGGDFSELVANTETAATSYTDGTVAAETRYTYRIKAINGAGRSERSRWLHIDTPAPPADQQNTQESADPPTATEPADGDFAASTGTTARGLCSLLLWRCRRGVVRRGLCLRLRRLRGRRLGRRGLLIGQACLEPLTDFTRVGVGDPGEEFRVDDLAGLGFPAAAGAVNFTVLARLPAAFDGVDTAGDFGFEGGLEGVRGVGWLHCLGSCSRLCCVGLAVGIRRLGGCGGIGGHAYSFAGAPAGLAWALVRASVSSTSGLESGPA